MHLHFSRALLLTLTLALVPGFAAATELPGSAAFVEAADAVIAAQGKVGLTPPPPVTDARVQTLLARTANIDAIFGNVQLSPEDIKQVMGLCEKTTQAFTAYALADIGSVRPANGEGPGAVQSRALELANRNAVTYQDAIVPMIAFTIRCSTRMLPLMTEFMMKLPAGERTPVRMAGLREMRTSFAGMLTGAIGTASQTGISVQNRHLAVSVVAEVAVTVAAALSVADRKAIQQTAIHVRAQAATADQSSLDAIARAFADERCEGLCTVGG